MDRTSGMMFIDECLNDDCAHVIEIMMNHHISKNYKDVRNIILGYNSKTGDWISKYGKSLARQENIKTESISICSFFSDPTDSFVKSSQMTFYDDDVFNTVRIHVDDAVKRKLDVLFTISENVIDYKYITDIIVTEWNMKNAVLLYKDNIPYNIYGELHFRPIEIRENSWREFRSIVRHRGLMIRDAFKLAVMSFLEDRYNMLKEKNR